MENGDQSIEIQRVFALVELQERVIRETREREAAGDPTVPKMMVVNRSAADRLNVYVSLSAQASDGQRIASGHHDFGIGGPRHGIGGVWHRYHGPRPDGEQELTEYIERNHHVGPADIQDGINQMLGRDPELHRPPKLAWTNLINALAEHDIHVTEDDLINTPLTMELHSEIQAELENQQ